MSGGPFVRNSLDCLRNDPATQIIIATEEYNPDIPLRVDLAGLTLLALDLNAGGFVCVHLQYADGRKESRAVAFHTDGHYVISCRVEGTADGKIVATTDKASATTPPPSSAKSLQMLHPGIGDQLRDRPQDLLFPSGVHPRVNFSNDKALLDQARCHSVVAWHLRQMRSAIISAPFLNPLKDLSGKFGILKRSGIFGAHHPDQTTAGQGSQGLTAVKGLGMLLLSTGILPLLLMSMLVLCTGCALGPKGKQVWNPFTWFSGRALTVQQGAQAREDKAASQVDAATDQAVHAAHVEAAKAGAVLALAEPTPDVALAVRFIQNSLGLLGQVDPLSATEAAELLVLVSDLRSKDHARVAAAEKRQAAIEQANLALSERIKLLEQKLAEAQAKTRQKDESLAAAFLRENELADTLRNQRFLLVAAGVGIVVLAGLSLYLRMGLGSVGAGLSVLPKLIGTEAASTVITQLDAKTDWLHQVLVGAGRKAAIAEQAKANSDTWTL